MSSAPQKTAKLIPSEGTTFDFERQIRRRSQRGLPEIDQVVRDTFEQGRDVAWRVLEVHERSPSNV